MSVSGEDELSRRLNSLIDLIYANGQGDFLDEYNIFDMFQNYRCLSSIYILFCNRRNLKQNPKFLKAWIGSNNLI